MENTPSFGLENFGLKNFGLGHLQTSIKLGQTAGQSAEQKPTQTVGTKPLAEKWHVS
jgi:hypothetical protein